MTDQPATTGSVTVSGSGPVAVGGDVTISGAVAAGRDVIIERLTVLSDDGAPFGDAATRPAAEADLCPYPGIQPFGEHQRAWFAGRDRDRRAVVERLERSEFLAIVGGSGSGKSSLLAAAVGPDFRDARQQVGESWSIRSIRPGIQPGTLLARALDAPEDGPTLWLVDQLEEAFGRLVDADERQRFFDLLQAIVAGHHGVAKVVVALRSDFYAALDAHEGMAAAIAQAQHRLLPLDEEALRDVILRPAEQVGLRVEPALLEHALQEVGSGSNQLPLLAYALRETWRRRRNGWLTLAGYVDAGGVREALENGARVVWDGLSATQRATARRTFLRLTSTGEGRAAARQRVTIDSLVTDQDDLGAVVDVLEQFTRARLVVADRDESGRVTVDIAHEALLREWSVLRHWLEDDLDVQRLQRELSEAARAWDEAGRDTTGLLSRRRLQTITERRAEGDLTVNTVESSFLEASARRERRDRQRSILLMILPIGLALAIAIIGVVVVQQRQTQEQKTTADALQLAAVAQSSSAARRDTAALVAVAAVDTEENETTIGALVDAVASPAGPLTYILTGDARATALASSLTPSGLAVI
jgi:hypothetical protein